MAGRIRASDIEEVKQRTHLGDLVGDHVALKSAGVDSMKGLCPFHDERSPSFHVRPNLGYYHCFGCGESGDAITFVQRMDHLSFSEAVERLAARLSYTLTYEEGGEKRDDGPNRARLLAANQEAAAFFVSQLASAEGEIARSFLAGRGFDQVSAETFGVGYAPRGWDGLSTHLAAKGYTQEEMLTAGLLSPGNRGAYDRFRGRVVWPIRDTSGQTLGFGARRLHDDDQGPKYLNTPESPIYHKSHVLYGLDLAKRAISRGKRVIVVEGYTDVMACHLAGVEEAVATCGTAFGAEHITVLRRIMGDDASGEVVFTFDPDEAGQKAALRAFSDEKRFTAQTYVAVAPEGFDPCDLRLHRGDEALQDLFTRKVPLFEFALRQAIGRFDLNSVEGRVSALRAAAPIVAEIRDGSLKPGYTRELARMLGAETIEVQRAVRGFESRGHQSRTTQKDGGSAQGLRSRSTQFPSNERRPDPVQSQSDDYEAPAQRQANLSTLPNNPGTWLERDALMAMLQQPVSVGEELMAQAVTAKVDDASLQVVRDAIGVQLPGNGDSRWLARVIDAAPGPYRGLITELAIAPMPQRNPDLLAGYARDVVVSLLERDLLSLKTELVSRLQRVGDPAGPEYRRIQEQLVALEQARRSLRE